MWRNGLIIQIDSGNNDVNSTLKRRSKVKYPACILLVRAERIAYSLLHRGGRHISEKKAKCDLHFLSTKEEMKIEAPLFAAIVIAYSSIPSQHSYEYSKLHHFHSIFAVPYGVDTVYIILVGSFRNIFLIGKFSGHLFVGKFHGKSIWPKKYSEGNFQDFFWSENFFWSASWLSLVSAPPVF